MLHQNLDQIPFKFKYISDVIITWKRVVYDSLLTEKKVFFLFFT